MELMMADKNPNRQGLQWIAKGLGLSLEPFTKLSAAVEGGQVKALYAIGAEIPDATFVEKAARLELLVVQATNEGGLTTQAHVILPASVHVEAEGTFPQAQGITQRFRRAYPPRQDSQPHWKWAVELAKEMGGTLAWCSSREVFRTVAPTIPELATFEWDKQAPIAQKKGINTPAAAADGRYFAPAREALQRHGYRRVRRLHHGSFGKSGDDLPRHQPVAAEPGLDLQT
jgi:NADH-quinone oxidoreductase subunit G